MFSAKKGNYRVPFYNVFGMTRSLTGNWTRDLPHSKPALGYRGRGVIGIVFADMPINILSLMNLEANAIKSVQVFYICQFLSVSYVEYKRLFVNKNKNRRKHK